MQNGVLSILNTLKEAMEQNELEIIYWKSFIRNRLCKLRAFKNAKLKIDWVKGYQMKYWQWRIIVLINYERIK